MIGTVLLFAAGLALFASAFVTKPRSRARGGIGLALMLGLIVVVVLEERDWATIELNPVVHRPADLAGTWRHDRSTLVLDSAGRWHCGDLSVIEMPCDSSLRAGRWLI